MQDSMPSDGPDRHQWQTRAESPQHEDYDLEELLNGLPQPGVFNLHSDRLQHMPEGNKELAWQNTLKLVEKYDKDFCQAYREQIDTLLVFAGLFSAVVTAFTIESYQWLQVDPADTSVELLREVVALLSQTTELPIPPPASSGISDGAVARINIFWFLSLTLSLSAALVAILCKQWLREFERGVGQSPETALAVRHIRFRGFEYWKVGSIVTSVPLMLQLALALFLTGAADLLWQLHTAVAACVTAVIGATLAFYASTTLLPLAQYAYICSKCCLGVTYTGNYIGLRAFTEPQCAFKSAQAWLAMRLAQPLIDRALKAYARCFTLSLPPDQYPLVLRPADSWITFDMNWMKRLEYLNGGPKCAYQALSWVAQNLDETHLSSWIWHCVWARWHRKRDTRDSIVDAVRDIDCVARAYPNLFQLERQSSAPARAQAMVFRCSLRSDLPANTAVELILRIGPQVGVDSAWTCEALKSVIHLYHGLSMRLTDDISIGLFRLAQLLTRAIIQSKLGTDSADRKRGPWVFHYITTLLYRGTSLGSTLIPAVSALALQWLGGQAVGEYEGPVAGITLTILSHYVTAAREPERLRALPGVTFAAQFVNTYVTLWPGSARSVHMGRSDLASIMQGLLEISSAHARNPTSSQESPTVGPLVAGKADATDVEALGSHAADEHQNVNLDAQLDTPIDLDIGFQGFQGTKPVGNEE